MLKKIEESCSIVRIGSLENLDREIEIDKLTIFLDGQIMLEKTTVVVEADIGFEKSWRTAKENGYTPNQCKDRLGTESYLYMLSYGKRAMVESAVLDHNRSL